MWIYVRKHLIQILKCYAFAHHFKLSCSWCWNVGALKLACGLVINNDFWCIIWKFPGGTMGERIPLCLFCPNCDQSHSPVVSFSCPLAVVLTHSSMDLPLNTYPPWKNQQWSKSVVGVFALAMKRRKGSAPVCLPSQWDQCSFLK